MANVIQDRAPFHELVNGKQFYPVDEYYVSESMTDEEAAVFLIIPKGYRLANSDEVPEQLAETKVVVPKTLNRPKPAQAKPAARRQTPTAAPVAAAPVAPQEQEEDPTDGEGEGAEPENKEEGEVF